MALALGFAASAGACSCAPQAPVESLRDADGAIVGRLVRVIPQGQTRAVYRYRVRHVYKRANGLRGGRMLDVHSARRSAACALPRRLGRNYGLFLMRRRGGGWFGGICGVVSPRRLHHAAASQRRAAASGSGSAACLA